jgi:hypothetical protein
VQSPFEQQVWDGPPQVPQLPFEHAPPMMGQAIPELVHTAFTQQPSPHAAPAQQAWPGPPHAVQIPFEHTSALSHARPGQQACPGAPHAWQIPPTQAPPPQLALPLHCEPSEALWEQPPPRAKSSKTTNEMWRIKNLLARYGSAIPHAGAILATGADR